MMQQITFEPSEVKEKQYGAFNVFIFETTHHLTMKHYWYLSLIINIASKKKEKIDQKLNYFQLFLKLK